VNLPDQPFQVNGAPARLLIVDDQPANLQMLGSMLGRTGMEIVPASDGPTALKRIAVTAPDLVLLDLMMPDMDGIELCRRILGQPAFATVPVIFLSAADEKSLVVRALEAGGVDYVTKPFNQAELLMRVRTHVALKSARDRLKRLAEDKDELLGILAHDLRNAIGSVHMTAQVLGERLATGDDARLAGLSDNILSATSRTLAFLKEFLANTVADHGLMVKREPVRVGEVVRQVASGHEGAADRKNIRLEVRLPESSPTLSADAAALGQVLDNLVSNAIKFSSTDKTVRVSLRDAGEHVDLVVKDEGPGFTAEDRLKMFGRYRRLSARPTAGEPSTGLGLSIVKRLVDEMGGELVCDSTPGAGTIFIVRLPKEPHGLSGH
jgi:two-component system sensor histidine kinase/response regulator